MRLFSCGANRGGFCTYQQWHLPMNCLEQITRPYGSMNRSGEIHDDNHTALNEAPSPHQTKHACQAILGKLCCPYRESALVL